MSSCSILLSDVDVINKELDRPWFCITFVQVLFLSVAQINSARPNYLRPRFVNRHLTVRDFMYHVLYKCSFLPLNQPRSFVVFLLWQLPQRTSHFSISAMIFSIAWPWPTKIDILSFLSWRWWNSKTMGSVSPHMTQGWVDKYCQTYSLAWSLYDLELAEAFCMWCSLFA